MLQRRGLWQSPMHLYIGTMGDAPAEFPTELEKYGYL
jgi:hypothetical protein